MKRFVLIFFVAIVLIIALSAGVIYRLHIYDTNIQTLAVKYDSLQKTVQSFEQEALLSDDQSSYDKKFMNAVFERIFTFYSYDDFLEARSQAETYYKLPSNFINRFYDTTELSGLYAEDILDIVCEFVSADFFLLDREEDVGYYYAVIELSTVKYSTSSIKMAFFIALADHGEDGERFRSIVYYNVK